jgi:preprotein translocase subunit SecG
MYSILLVVHVMITLALIAIILVQNNSGDMGSLSGSSSTNFMSGRTAASFITHATSFLGAAFIITSLALGIITSRTHEGNGSIMDKLATPAPVSGPASPGTDHEATAFKTPASKPTQPAPAKPAPAATQSAPMPAKSAPTAPSMPRPE